MAGVPELGRQAPPTPEARRARPVKWWAVVGALCVALEIYVITAWIVSGKATPTPDGPTPIPDWMIVVARTWEALGVVALGFFVYWFLIRPWRREGRLTLDGMFVIVFILIYWQDPLLNYFQTVGTYSTALINLGSWTTNVPGWLSPNGNRFAEPIVWAGPAYVYAVFGAMILANWVMRKAKARWPQLGTFGIVMVAAGFFLVFDFVAESIWMRLGFYAFPGSIESMTLFHGHYYQYPIYELVLWGGTWTAFACLRYFRNDKGETVAERGVDELRASSRQKSGIRLLALFGIVNVIFLVGYNVPIQWFGLHADPPPADIVKRSYLLDGLCGPGTDYACGGPDVPIPRPDSAHLDPEGRLVPAGSTGRASGQDR